MRLPLRLAPEARLEWIVAVIVVLTSAFALLTLTMWPPPPSTAVAEDLLAGTPKWWQFRAVAALGILLSVAPSYVIYRFDDFFHANEVLRYPVVGILLALEVLVISLLAFGLARLIRRVASEG